MKIDHIVAVFFSSRDPQMISAGKNYEKESKPSLAGEGHKL